ncbi:MAG: DUF3379 family protein [Xanthomonadales bacterium]|nr:DUF3379 family protein [Xanthomonadales bacterium]
MSMNFSEFKRQLNSDPASQDAEYQAARRSGPEFVLAAAASDAFEQQLQRATRLPADSHLIESLKELPATATISDESLLYPFRYAIAATVVLAFSGLLLMQQIGQPWDSAEDYVAHHYSYDGNQVLDMADNPNTGELNDILATFDLQMDASMSQQVRFVKYCPTPEGNGVHLVLKTEQGLVTVIIMPGQKVQDGARFAFNDMEVSLANLPGRDMSLAIIASPEQMNAESGANLGLSLKNALSRRATRA